MQPYQQYNKYRRPNEKSGFKYGKILIILAILFVLYLIVRSLFSGGTEVESILPDNKNDNSEVNVNTETNTNSETNSNENSNANENSNSNENANVNVDTSSADGFDIASCDSIYSRGRTDEKKVALTFNVGTSKEGEISKLLEVLKNTNTSASFFARGDVAENNPDLIKKIDSAGFHIYNFSYNHPRFTDLPTSGITEQLQKAEDAISQQTGKTTKPFFRPPYGEADQDVLAAVTDAGYCPVTWTVDALDWSTDYTTEESKERVLSNISNGAIVLMQAGNSVTAEIVPSIISELNGQGYNFVSLEDIL